MKLIVLTDDNITDSRRLLTEHCTDFSAKAELARKFGAKNIGVGFKYTIL